jgi:N-acyl-D-amino-acid deacylase
MRWSARTRTIDVATHVPHAALRAYVMGERGGDPLEAAQRRRARRHGATPWAKGLDAGALGISTSRTERHRTSRGESLGTLRAREPELQALASVLKVQGPWVCSNSSPTVTARRTTTSPRQSSR